MFLYMVCNYYIICRYMRTFFDIFVGFGTSVCTVFDIFVEMSTWPCTVFDIFVGFGTKGSCFGRGYCTFFDIFVEFRFAYLRNYIEEECKIQKENQITVVKSWITDIADGISPLSDKDMMVYVILRHWAKPCADIELAQMITEADDDAWIYELNCHLFSPKSMSSYLYDAHRETISSYANNIIKNIAALICAGLVACYDKKGRFVYSSSEFTKLHEKWKDMMDVVMYFPVPTDFISVPDKDVENIIRYCRENKEKNVDYYIMLYLMVMFNFSITKISGQCFIRSPRSSHFTSRRKLWEKSGEVLYNAVGIRSEAKRYVDGDGTVLATEYYFFENNEAYQVYKSRYVPAGVVEKTKNDTAASDDVGEEYVWQDFATRDFYEYIPGKSYYTVEEYNRMKNEAAEKEWRKRKNLI